MTDQDRTVFCVLKDGGEIVRYDKAGKWWLEYLDGSMRPGRPLSVKQAAYLAVEEGHEVRRNLPGGQTFYRLVSRYTGNEGRA